jgi:hypothetical protein
VKKESSFVRELESGNERKQLIMNQDKKSQIDIMAGSKKWAYMSLRSSSARSRSGTACSTTARNQYRRAKYWGYEIKFSYPNNDKINLIMNKIIFNINKIGYMK